MELDALKHILLDRMEERGQKKPGQRVRSGVLEAPRTVDQRLDEIEEEVAILDSHIDQHQQEINRCAARKAVLQREVEATLTHFARLFGVSVYFVDGHLTSRKIQA